MKKIKIKIGRKKYRLSIGGCVGILLAIILATCGCAFLASRAINQEEAPSEPTAEPTPTASSRPKETYDSSANKIKEDEYSGTILAETKDMGQSYIDETLFLGDSNTARFLRFLNKDGTTYTNLSNTVGVVGMGIDAISSLPCLDTSMGMLTIPQAVTALQPTRIIITFGTNNLSGTDTDATYFIDRYEAQLKYLVQSWPYAELIVNSLPPVAEVRSYTNVSMNQIDAYNKAIVEMCRKNGWKYLNSAAVLKDEKSGYARKGYMAEDGLHLSNEGLSALFDYIRTHGLEVKDERPKPLAAMPAVYGVPDGLIKTNPLNDEEAKVQECGENAWGDTTGCYCNTGFEGDPKQGCTAVKKKPEETAKPTPTPCPEGMEHKEDGTCGCKTGLVKKEDGSGCAAAPTPPVEPQPTETPSEDPAPTEPPVEPEPTEPSEPEETPGEDIPDPESVDTEE